VDDTGNVQQAAVSVPVDTDVFLLSTGQRDVKDVGLFCIEDVNGRVERVGVVLVLAVLETLGLLANVTEEGMAGPAAEETREVKGAALAGIRRRRMRSRSVVRTTRAVGETASSSATASTTSGTTTSTASTEARTSTALVLVRDNLLGIRGIGSHGVGGLALLVVGVGISLYVCSRGLALGAMVFVMTAGTIPGACALIPRTPYEAIGLRGRRRTARTRSMGARETVRTAVRTSMRARTTGAAWASGTTRTSGTSKGVTGHEGEVGGRVVINSATRSLIGIECLDKVPEGHRVRLLARAHDYLSCLVLLYVCSRCRGRSVVEKLSDQ
jgi:hypothetical protein